MFESRLRSPSCIRPASFDDDDAVLCQLRVFILLERDAGLDPTIRGCSLTSTPWKMFLKRSRTKPKVDVFVAKNGLERTEVVDRHKMFAAFRVRFSGHKTRAANGVRIGGETLEQPCYLAPHRHRWDVNFVADVVYKPVNGIMAGPDDARGYKKIDVTWKSGIERNENHMDMDDR